MSVHPRCWSPAKVNGKTHGSDPGDAPGVGKVAQRAGSPTEELQRDKNRISVNDSIFFFCRLALFFSKVALIKLICKIATMQFGI